MSARNLLPDRIRVVVNAVRQDLRNVRLAITAERRGTFTKSTRPAGIVPRGRVRLPERPPHSDSVRADAAPEEQPLSIAYFSFSDIEVEVGPNETILQAGLAAGVDLIFSCGLGGCGACMLTCTEGEVEYDDVEATCLLEQDIDEGLCLACVGRPRGRIIIDA